ncbi:MAG: hypothetical protein A07HB70_01898 [uncultured archaeon A07HB70]|nr:MAG: hypothetical protein A07HB70_01898 [uncultured archaeon A07HB70]
MVDQSWRRRRVLRGVCGAALAGGLAGCVAAGQGREDPAEAGRNAGATVTVSGEPPCADSFRVVEAAARVSTGRVPRVRLRFVNEGDAAVDYEAVVKFRQGTSLGLPEPSGRTTLAGGLAPGEATVRTASDDGPEARNTDSYAVEATVSCRR